MPLITSIWFSNDIDVDMMLLPLGGFDSMRKSSQCSLKRYRTIGY